MFHQSLTPKRAFSLIEVMVSIGIIVIAMVPLIGLIPIGMKNSQASYGETVGMDLLTAVIQDFRSSPIAQSQSPIFHLSALPYNGASLGTVNRILLDRYLNILPQNKKTSEACFEVTWVYTKIPPPESLMPVEAKFTVYWPPTPDEIHGASKEGQVTLVAAFPNPELE